MKLRGPKVKDYLRMFRVEPGKKVHLKRYDTGWVRHELLKTMSEERAKGLLEEMLEKDRAALAEAQELLAASQEYGMLIVLQGMDTAGKDGDDPARYVRRKPPGLLCPTASRSRAGRPCP